MNNILNTDETMQDVIKRLEYSFDTVQGIAPVAYWYEMLNPDGRIKNIHFSDQMRKMLGYKSKEEFPDELNTLMTFTHPDDVHIMLDNAIAAGTGKIEKYNVQYRIRKVDGSYMWCNATGQVVKDYKGTTVGMYGAFIDITGEIELKKNQDADQQHNDLLNTMIGDDGLFIIDCKNDTRRTVHDRLIGSLQYNDTESYSSAFARYVENCVAESDREMMRKFVSPSFMLECTKKEKKFTVQYLDITAGLKLYHEMTIMRFSETEVLQGFVEKNQEILEKRVSEKLYNEYDALYFVDLDEKKIYPTRKSRVSSAGVFEIGKEYTIAVHKFAETVAPQYKQDWLNFSNPEYMKQYLGDEDHREYVYELPGTSREMRRFTVDVFERINGKPSTVLFSFMGIDKLSAKAMQLERKMIDSARIISALSEDFGCVNYIRIKEKKADDTVEGYRTSELLKKLIPGWEEEKNFSKKLGMLLMNLVYEPDKEQFYASTRREKILEELGKSDAYFVNTRLYIEDEIRYYQFKFSAVRDQGKIIGFVVGFHSIDEQMKKEIEANSKLAEVNRIIGALTEDFTCINYVELTADKNTDIGINYKTSELLMRIIPGWEEEKSFTKKLLLLNEYAVYEPDKESYLRDIDRDNVFKNLVKSDVYFVNFRMVIEGEIKHYQLKFSAIKEAGRPFGAVIGLHSIDDQVKKEHEVAKQFKELNEKLVDSSIRNSISQMQPHFLYNALASIREIILDDPEYASDLVYDFTTHLRACIKSMDIKEPVSFEQELANIKAYVNIEKMRLGDRLKMVYDLDVTDFKVVALGIQPMVENAIKHGISKKGVKGGTVTIKTFVDGDFTVVQVIDDGIGFDYEQLKAEVESGKRDSTGVKNYVLRFEKMMNAKVNIDSKIGEGTTVTIRLPR